MIDEKEILKDLLVDDEVVKEQLTSLVKKAKNIFQIQNKDGKILFKNFQNLKNPARICAFLMGKKFGKKLGLNVKDVMTITEIGDELGIPSTTLSSPMGDLTKNGYVIKDGKNYEIAYNRLPEIFEDFFSGVNDES